MKCPVCLKKTKKIGPDNVASVALGALIAQGSLYVCKKRHVWVWCDPPIVALTEIGKAE